MEKVITLSNKYTGACIAQSTEGESWKDFITRLVTSSTDLYGADLRGADLRGANLCGAYLRGADLREADLRGANLCGAYLRGADLREADLREADLRGADLREADLRGANLYKANLYEANLRGADLYGADLRGANLRGVDLRGANLRGVDLSKLLYDYSTTGIHPAPSGTLKVWGKKSGHMVEMIIPETARRSCATTRKHRAEFAYVLRIDGKTGTQFTHKGCLYRAGYTVWPDAYDEGRWNECSNGIHFFLTEEEAKAW